MPTDDEIREDLVHRITNLIFEVSSGEREAWWTLDTILNAIWNDDWDHVRDYLEEFDWADYQIISLFGLIHDHLGAVGIVKEQFKRNPFTQRRDAEQG